MQNKVLRKGLVIGIIILFVSISVFSSVSSKDVSISNNKIVDDNKEIRLLEDNQQEIYTIFDNVNVEDFEALIVFPFSRIIIGWIEMSSYAGFTIKGYKRPIFPCSESWFELKVEYVYAPFFIGQWEPDWNEPFWSYIDGIAYGNIEWSK